MSKPAEEHRLTEEECEKRGGHCYADSHQVLMSNPPIYVRACKHCGKAQHGRPQPVIRWE